MDFVNETMRRQGAAWLALFGGETETAEASETTGAAQPPRRREGEARRSEATGGEESAAEVTSPQQRAQAETAQQELLRREGEQLLRQLRTSKAEGETAERGGSATESLAAESLNWEAEAARREGRSALETADARAISRRFERDARRYDGGFRFY